MAHYGLTVQTAPSALPVTLEQAKAHLRVTHTDEDDIITALCTAARDWVEETHGITLITTSWTLTLDRFPSKINLPRAPVASITSVKYDDANGTEQTLSSSAYKLDTASFQPRLVEAVGYSWPSTYSQINAVRIIYQAGFGSTYASVPNPILAALKLIVGHLYEHREQVLVGVTAAELPAGVGSLLAPYKRHTTV